MSNIGLDIGTTSCKVTAFDLAGRVLASAGREYSIITPRVGWAEQDAELVWRLAWDALCEVCAQLTGDPPHALAISAQGEAVVPVDAAGRPMRSVILGMDTRCTEQNQRLIELFGAKNLFERTGMPVHTINTLPKLMWLSQHEPEIYARAEQFLLYEDFVLRRLTGRAVLGHCLASRTQLYALHEGRWDNDLLDVCGLEPGRLGKLAPADGGVVGELCSDLAWELGLNQPLAIVAGGHDQACAALGSGLVSAGRAMVSTGTAEVVEVAMTKPVLDERLRDGGISVYRHVVPGLYLAMTLNHSGGILLRWFRDAFCRWERDQALQEDVDAYDLMLAGAPDGPTSLMVMPHLAGSGTPTLDTDSRGAILGLSLDTDRATLCKAMLEGLCYELRINTDLLQDAGIPLEGLFAVGGGARSALWLTLKADICGVPVRVPEVTDAASLGAALLAGIGVGDYTGPEEAVAAAVRTSHELYPEPIRQSEYDGRFALYEQLYPTLSGMLHELARA